MGCSLFGFLAKSKYQKQTLEECVKQQNFTEKLFNRFVSIYVVSNSDRNNLFHPHTFTILFYPHKFTLDDISASKQPDLFYVVASFPDRLLLRCIPSVTTKTTSESISCSNRNDFHCSIDSYLRVVYSHKLSSFVSKSSNNSILFVFYVFSIFLFVSRIFAMGKCKVVN